MSFTNNPMSDEVSAVPQPLPDVPVLSGSVTGSDISLMWSPSETAQFFSITGDHYQIFWNQTGSAMTADALIDTIKQNSWVLSAMPSGEYYFTVRKVNLRGASALSNEVHVTVP